LLHSFLDEYELKHFERLPVKVGFTGLDGDFERVMRYAFHCDALLDDPVTLSKDFSSYDWVKPVNSLYRIHFRVRALCVRPGPDAARFVRLLKTRYIALQAIRVLDAGGRVSYLPRPIQLSGRFSTLADNSREQVFIRYLFDLVSKRPLVAALIATGDDTVDRLSRAHVREYLAFLKDFGLDVKEHHLAEGDEPYGIEFCSRELCRDGTYVFTSAPRQWWKLQHVTIPHKDQSGLLSALINFAGSKVDYAAVSSVYKRLFPYASVPDRSVFIRRMVGEN
jgi:hypothetical protein